MKMLMSKKGAIGFVPIVIAIMFCAVIAIVLINQQKAYDDGILTLGRVPKAMVEAYAKAEMAREYIKYAGKYAGEQAIYNIGTEGGYNQYSEVESTCGVTGKYTIWKSGSNDCVPTEETIKSAFNYSLSENFYDLLSNFILNYDLVTGAAPTIYESTDIDLRIDFGSSIEITGTPTLSLTSYVDEEEGELALEEVLEPSSLMIIDEFNGFEYGIEPYFKSTVPINIISIYSDVSKALNDNLNDLKSCEDETCFNNMAKKLSDETNYEWSIKLETGNVLFDVSSKTDKIIALTDKKLEYIGVPIRFAIINQ